MRNVLLSLACTVVLLCSIVSGHAQAVGGNASLLVTSVSASVQLPANTQTFPSLLIVPAPSSSGEVFYLLGGSAVAALTTSPALPPGGICINVGPSTYLAAITSMGTATLRLTQLNTCAGFSGSGGRVSQYTPGSQDFTTPGANTFTSPPGVSVVYFDAVGAGAGGGAGGATGAAAGGGGGGSGAWCLGYALNVTAGAVITINIPTGGAGGTSNGNGSGASGNLTITGANDVFPALGGGQAGIGTTGTTGGAGGNGGGSNGASGTGGAAAGFGARPSFTSPNCGGGMGGGGGGSTASGGAYGLAMGIWASNGGGTGNASGAGGAPSMFGNGGAGGNSTPTSGASPTLGWGGGGGGGGPSNTATGNGGAGVNGFARARW